MAYTNYLLFNNIFLKNLNPNEEEMEAARYLVHESARDWYKEENFVSSKKIAESWIKPLLNLQSLDLVPSELDENAWNIVAPWERDNPLALCYIAPEGTNLDGYSPDKTLPKGQHWMIRTVDLASNTNANELRWAVLTNGVQWRLLDAQALRRYEAYLEIDLFSLLNGEDDPLAAFLFYRLFRLENSFERDEETGQNRLDGFLNQSIEATEQTEVYLKTAVSDNLATPGGADGIMAQLCMGIVQDVDPNGKKIFNEEERAAIYRDATYMLYRLMFILYAEARNLLPMDREDYRAVSLNRLIDEAVNLRANPQESSEVLTNLWDQLDVLTNAIHYSDEYMGIPPYNGGLFENRDKPYLRDYKIRNTYLAEAIYQLAFHLDEKNDRPPKRIDYRDLSVRHLGSLYEGMIEYQLFIAEEELLARQEKGGKVKYLPSTKTTSKPTDEIILPGKVYFAQSSHERKATGTHYTHEYLVARLVKQTVERLLDERWNEFQPNLEQFLVEIEATPDGNSRRRLQDFTDSQLETFIHQQVLSLRICDPAMGSGHFLVYIAHTLTNFILSALSKTTWENPAANLDPVYWRRLVVKNCLYGVDINNMAVELAKLSLWLATMQLGRPLSFLDHHLKRGNSLLGVSLEEITAILEKSTFNQETRQTRVAEASGQYGFRELPQVQQKLAQANGLLERIATRRVERVVDVEEQESDHETIQTLLKPYKQIGDLLIAQKMGWKARDADLHSIASALEAEATEILNEQQRDHLERAQILVGSQKCTHWILEFPQVFMRNNGDWGGFDVVIGNPPFLGGKKISTQLGVEFSSALKILFPPGFNTTDLCAYFFRLGFGLIKNNYYLGLLATNTISQGDTRESGLAKILENNGKIIYADRFVSWQGDATVEVNLICIVKHNEIIPHEFDLYLDGKLVTFISSWLDEFPEQKPSVLAQNTGLSFVGDFVRGTGFILEPNEASKLLESTNLDNCLYRYLDGRDLNGHYRQQPRRYIICFHDYTFEEASHYHELMEIVKQRVKPERDKIKNGSAKKNWWLFGGYKKELRKAIALFGHVIARAEVSDFHMLSFLPTNQIFSNKVIVFAFDDYYHFSLLQSNVHDIWIRRNASTMRTDVSYGHTDCFQTFPFPQELSEPRRIVAKQAGQMFYQQRQGIMSQTQLGLTKIYNRFHYPTCQDDDIQKMRRLHAEMDKAVLACYRWNDIDLQHNFYPNDRKKIRYMPSREAQREIFRRLLALNQEIATKEMGEEDNAVEDV